MVDPHAYEHALYVPEHHDAIADPDLSTVDASGLPPLRAYIEMVFTDATGTTFTVGNMVPVL